MPDVLCYCTAARKVARKISTFYDARLATSGLSVAQYSILAEIERRSATPPTMKELAAALTMDRSTLGQNLQPLLRDGLIALATNADDARSKLVALSARGRKKFAVAHRLWLLAQREYASLIGKETADRARKDMNALASASQL